MTSLALGGSWIAGLRLADLNRLRAVVKSIHMAHYPDSAVTDKEADKFIESLGPIVAEQMIKTAVDSFNLA